MPHPTKQRRPLSSFDARSVMLFAALTMGGALAQASPGTNTPSRCQASHQRTPPEPGAAPGGGARPIAALRASGTRS